MFVKDDDTQTAESSAVVGADEIADQIEDDTQTDETETSDDDETEDDTTTFSRTYVEKLRRESAGYRERANQADELGRRLHTALVAATGRMADPTDLAYEPTHLDDEDALIAAIDELLAAKPHLASRRPFGDVGQGNRGKPTDAPVNLADLLRARA